MVERQLVVPVAPEALWDALTQPEQLSAWFGYQVEWELIPGGSARWTRPDNEDARRGVIHDVTPGRRLAYRWWPESGRGPASTVTYDLESPDDESPGATRLTVRETVIPRPEEAGDSPRACASMIAEPASAGWSSWDTRTASLWLQLQTSNLLVKV